MAKKKDESVEDAETTRSIGAQMTQRLTQRERNLKVKAEMIAKGLRDAPENPTVRTQKDKNLKHKAKKNEAGKSKGSK